MKPKYPDVFVQLSGEDGNMGSIIGRARREARRCGISNDELNTFAEEVMNSSSYNEALQTVIRWFDTA